MRGTHSQLVVTSVYDEATGQEKPLFSFPVQICKATEDVEVRFDRADPNGFEIQRVWKSKGDGTIYDEGDLIKGVRSGDTFSTISPGDIEAITEATAIESLTVERAVPLSDVPVDRVSGFYYLQAPPKGGSQKPYELLRRALEPKAKKPAMALQVKFMTRSRQKLGVVYSDPERHCLVLLVLVFAESIREPDEAILAPAHHAEVDAKQVAMARKVVEALADSDATFDSPVDEALGFKRELIERAVNGEAIEAPAQPSEAFQAVGEDELAKVLEASLA